MNHFPLFLSAMDLQNETIKFIHKSIQNGRISMRSF
jgi:hypothetical protein